MLFTDSETVFDICIPINTVLSFDVHGLLISYALHM